MSGYTVKEITRISGIWPNPIFNAIHHFFPFFRLGSKGANPSSKMFQVTMEKAQKGKGGRTRGSPAPATGEIKPAKATKRKSSEVMADESSEGSGLGIGMVWSCQESRYQCLYS